MPRTINNVTVYITNFKEIHGLIHRYRISPGLGALVENVVVKWYGDIHRVDFKSSST